MLLHPPQKHIHGRTDKGTDYNRPSKTHDIALDPGSQCTVCQKNSHHIHCNMKQDRHLDRPTNLIGIGKHHSHRSDIEDLQQIPVHQSKNQRRKQHRTKECALFTESFKNKPPEHQLFRNRHDDPHTNQLHDHIRLHIHIAVREGGQRQGRQHHQTI